MDEESTTGWAEGILRKLFEAKGWFNVFEDGDRGIQLSVDTRCVLTAEEADLLDALLLKDDEDAVTG